MQMTTTRADYKKLRRDISAAYSQIAQLDKRRKAQAQEIESVECELDANHELVQDKRESINFLTAEVDSRKCVVDIKAEQIAAELRAKEEIQRELAALPSHIADLEQRYDAQSTHNELQTLPEHTITFLTTVFMQARGGNRAKARQIATARRDFEHLLRLLSTPIIIVPERYVAAAQSQVSIASGELPQDKLEMSASSVKPAYCRMISLSPITTLHGVSLIEELREAERQIAELRMECDNKSKKLDSVRNDLQVMKSLVEEKERTITTLTAECDQLERAVVTMAENLAAVRRDIEQLLHDIAAFSPHIADLRRRYDVQSKAIRDQLQTKTSLLAHIIAFLTTFTQAQSEDRGEAEQIATARRDLEHLQCILSEQMTSLQKRCRSQSQELKSVRNKLHSIPKLHQPTYIHTVLKGSCGSWKIDTRLISLSGKEGYAV
jgi:chromosome segregation ATPase